MIDDINEPRKVNTMLGEKPSVGPIPGDQVLPWLAIAGIVLLFQILFSLHWLHAGLMLLWGIATWWLLTGKRAWRFLSRFHRRPRWVRSVRYYESPFTNDVGSAQSPILSPKKIKKSS